MRTLEQELASTSTALQSTVLQHQALHQALQQRLPQHAYDSIVMPGPLGATPTPTPNLSMQPQSLAQLRPQQSMSVRVPGTVPSPTQSPANPPDGTSASCAPAAVSAARRGSSPGAPQPSPPSPGLATPGGDITTTAVSRTANGIPNPDATTTTAVPPGPSPTASSSAARSAETGGLPPLPPPLPALRVAARSSEAPDGSPATGPPLPAGPSPPPSAAATPPIDVPPAAGSTKVGGGATCSTADPFCLMSMSVFETAMATAAGAAGSPGQGPAGAPGGVPPSPALKPMSSGGVPSSLLDRDLAGETLVAHSRTEYAIALSKLIGCCSSQFCTTLWLAPSVFVRPHPATLPRLPFNNHSSQIQRSTLPSRCPSPPRGPPPRLHLQRRRPHHHQRRRAAARPLHAVALRIRRPQRHARAQRPVRRRVPGPQPGTARHRHGLQWRRRAAAQRQRQRAARLRASLTQPLRLAAAALPRGLVHAVGGQHTQVGTLAGKLGGRNGKMSPEPALALSATIAYRRAEAREMCSALQLMLALLLWCAIVNVLRILLKWLLTCYGPLPAPIRYGTGSVMNSVSHSPVRRSMTGHTATTAGGGGGSSLLPSLGSASAAAQAFFSAYHQNYHHSAWGAAAAAPGDGGGGGGGARLVAGASGDATAGSTAYVSYAPSQPTSPRRHDLLAAIQVGVEWSGMEEHRILPLVRWTTGFRDHLLTQCRFHLPCRDTYLCAAA